MRVFISHSDQDSDLAAKVAEVLQRNGLEVWYNGEVLPGDNWAQKVAEALEQSQAMVVLITPESRRSKWMEREIEYALGKREFSGRLIPVVVGRLADIQPDDIPWILRRLHIIEIPTAAEQEEGIEKIAEALRVPFRRCSRK